MISYDMHQLFPIDAHVSPKDFLLKDDLLRLSFGRIPYIYTSFICDRDEVIGVKNSQDLYEIPSMYANGFDEMVFRQLAAHADAIVVSKEYLNKFFSGTGIDNKITIFDDGQSSADLGLWRLSHGFKVRNPKIVTLSRSLDFKLPESFVIGGLDITLFTTTTGITNKEKVACLKQGGIKIENIGDQISGQNLLSAFKKTGLRTVYFTTGPGIFRIIYKDKILTRVYITRVDTQIGNGNQDLLYIDSENKFCTSREFIIMEKYHMENSSPGQDLLVYNKRD